MATTTKAAHSLRLERTISATPEQVFEAWTNPAKVARWFSPSAEFTVIVHALDPRAGGRFRIEMKHQAGNSHIAHGEYRTVRKPSQLSFTWRWEENPAMPDTLVSIDLTAEGGGSRLVLTHAQFDSEAQCAEHEKGWAGCLARLDDGVR
jgi:uncharacterized protein YndB with AHSA1/START domain